jgi:molybdopterin synthase catalytic subunit
MEGTNDNDDNDNEDTSDDDDRFLLVVSETLPSLDECYRFVTTTDTNSSPASSACSCGAVATFVGITRDNFAGRRVVRLSYEGYVSMAIKEMKRLCLDAVTVPDRYPSVRKIALVHILGDCPVGCPSVIIACAAPHRREALHCCEYLIDELKARIPIWKLEVYADDDGGDHQEAANNSVWKENVEWSPTGGTRRRVMLPVHQPPELPQPQPPQNQP